MEREDEFKETNEKRRVVSSPNEMKEENNKTVKRRKIKVLDMLVIIVILVLLCVYVPRGYKLYESKRKEEAKEKIITYPLEVKITETDSELFTEMLKDYAIGILEGVDPSDGFDDIEKVNFVRHILSEKYSSSGVIAKLSMNNMIKKYFDVENLDYTSLGFKKLSVYNKNETEYIYNITKLEQFDENGEIYLAHVDRINEENISNGKYDDSSIDERYVFTLKKIKEENSTLNTDGEATDTNTNDWAEADNSTSDKNLITEEYRYIIEKVELEVLQYGNNVKSE